MNKWLNNLLGYEKNKEKGICPCCGSKNIKVEEIRHNQRKSTAFFCLDCQKGEHFDGFMN